MKKATDYKWLSSTWFVVIFYENYSFMNEPQKQPLFNEFIIYESRNEYEDNFSSICAYIKAQENMKPMQEIKMCRNNSHLYINMEIPKNVCMCAWKMENIKIT